MSDSTFQRENRYIIIKRSDLKKVPVGYRSSLVDPMFSLLSHLPHRQCLVIESDWPEYEPVWKMIEQRMTDATPVVERQPECAHEWTDDGQFMLVCTICGEQENHDPQWRDMETAPKDGTLIRLLVEFEDHSTEDETEAPTIGANNFDNDEQDEWLFAGWCWTHDHWTQGKGTPIGWLPMIDTAPPELAELQATIERQGQCISGLSDELIELQATIAQQAAVRDALQQRLNVADQRNADRDGTCEWSQDDDSGIWNSGCGVTWSFHDDGPTENGMHFCNSCGKTLVVEAAGADPDEVDDWLMNPCKKGHRDVGAAGGVAACNQCDEKIEAATTQEAFERWNATHPKQ